MPDPPPRGKQRQGNTAVELIRAGFARCRTFFSDASGRGWGGGARTEGGGGGVGHRRIVYEPARQRVRPDRTAA